MYQFADPIFVAERQRTLRQEAANERLTRLARPIARPAAHRQSLAGRLGPILTSRLGRLLPVGR